MIEAMRAKKVAVIIPTFNAVGSTIEAVASILGQSYSQTEVIVIDDGSTPENIAALKSEIDALSAPNISLILLGINRGVAAARNAGIESTTARYVAFLDADDIWHPQKLERHLAFMDEKSAAISYTSYQNTTEDGRIISERVPPAQIRYRQLRIGNVIGNSTVILDSDLLDIPTVPDLRRRQDFAFWLKILKDGHIGYGLQEPLTQRRLAANSLSGNKLKAVRATWKMYREAEGMSVPMTAWIFSLYILKTGMLSLRSRWR